MRIKPKLHQLQSKDSCRCCSYAFCSTNLFYNPARNIFYRLRRFSIQLSSIENLARVTPIFYKLSSGLACSFSIFFVHLKSLMLKSYFSETLRSLSPMLHFCVIILLRQIGIFERCAGDLFHVHENCALANSSDKNFVRLRLITIKYSM